MKKFKNILTLCMALAMLLSCIPAVHAAEVPDATINYDNSCSLTIWKYDWTNAVKDGVWNEDSFISTGWRESYVEDVLGDAVRYGDDNDSPDHSLGNGQTSNGYAIKGVGFAIANVAIPWTFSESANDDHPDYNLTKLLYAFNKADTAELLAAIGLPDGEGRYENADYMATWPGAQPMALTEYDPNEFWFYESDVLNKAMASALADNSTVVKDALETYIHNHPNTIYMDLTDNNGKTIERNLEIGLYIVVEDSVPEMVTSTTNPFFVSLPMTTVSGNVESASPEGGHFWNYDVVVYPKNETGIPTLEKQVRESMKDTGNNNGTDNINDGFEHNATGSAGDMMEYQILSTLPTITSKATSLTTYNFYDTISAGLTYNKALKDVKIEFFTDANCTDKVATWVQDDGRFTVTYSSDDRHMTIDVTEIGLAEINGTELVEAVTLDEGENVNGKLYSGYSNYTVRVTYTATINSDASFVYGENGNCNEIVLTWRRTSGDYYDTLIDDCHVYSFGMDLTKLFSDVDAETAEDTGMYKHVKFKIWNEADGYWLTATRNDAEGVYYVTGHVTEEADATIFYPVTSGDQFGKVIVKGMEDDWYTITEVETANGYTLLKDSIYLDIYAMYDDDRICDIYSKDVLGLLQNDPHYCHGKEMALDLNDDNVLHLTNIPQKYMEHNLLTAYATVDGNDVTMLSDNGSENAEAPLTIVNTRGFDLPQTGDTGTMWYSVIGIVAMASALGVIILVSKTKKREDVAQQ
ncbi:MAG: SpaH/EbpB family LPXTG-anchored major pilin [Oscillospiraceae bacterium]|nr:SpaH/EbpB family LPXTG-anchored major pilin [Oscillospiraceae bacterium]MBQ7000209.1 SpaH/EbpB family LPXTG-anchored major pilin [Oscillospiraceae bacterium]